MTPALVAFDVNETLLDVSHLQPALSGLVGGTFSLDEWFTRTLHGSLIANHLGRYRPFAEIGVDALLWLAERAGVALSPDAARIFAGGMTRLPAHPGVTGALASLSSQGVRMIALTNGSDEAAQAQLAHAGIANHLERVISVSSVQRFKPAPAVYLYAAAMCDVDIDGVLMVAAHDWDVAGAQSVGAKGCFVSRRPWGIGDVSPTVTVADLAALAELLGRDGADRDRG